MMIAQFNPGKELALSTSRSVEYKIIRQLLGRRSERFNRTVMVERFITSVAIVACLGLLAAFVPGLLWVLLLAALVLTLGA